MRVHDGCCTAGLEAREREVVKSGYRWPGRHILVPMRGFWLRSIFAADDVYERKRGLLTSHYMLFKLINNKVNYYYYYQDASGFRVSVPLRWPEHFCSLPQREMTSTQGMRQWPWRPVLLPDYQMRSPLRFANGRLARRTKGRNAGNI
jgi:hypothetical protein